MDLLEAAHIVPYRSEEHNHPSNGLLLRADIHTLFDLNLLRIRPNTYRIELAKEVMGDEVYRCLHGQILRLKQTRPSDECLKIRWSAYEDSSHQMRPEAAGSANRIPEHSREA